MPQDPLEALLKRSPLIDTQRGQIWDLYEASPTPDDLTAKLASLSIPKDVKQKLFILKSQETAPVPSELSETQPEGSALSRFASNAGEMLNPLAMAEGLYNTVRHPIDTATNVLASQKAQYDKAKQAQAQGLTSEMVGHSIAAAIPILGPLAAEAGEQIGRGDVAGGLGKAAGLLAPMAGAEALRMRRGANPVKSDALARQAEQTVSKRVLAPANPQYRRPAQDIAPQLLERGVQGDRIALQQYADNLIGDAQQRIDAVIDTYPADATLKTTPVLDVLDNALDRMSFKGKNGAREVNPTKQAEFDELSKLRAFVSGRGEAMTFDDMRRLRQQFDTTAAESGAFAKAKGDPSLSASGQAALEAGNALRKQIAAERPELAVPFADMHLGITLRDILDPAKGRPATPSVTTGATGGLHTTGALIGSVVSDIPGIKAIAAFLASDLIPRIKNAQVSPQNQLRLANDMYKLSEALKAGKTGPVQKTLLNMSLYVPGLQAGRLTTEPATQTGAR